MKSALFVFALLGFGSALHGTTLPPNYTEAVTACLPRLHQTAFHMAKNHAARPRGAVIDEIVLHDTASSRTRKWNDAVAYMASPGDGRTVSIHYMVGKQDGQLASFVDESRQAFHVKAGHHNSRSVGIEMFRRKGEDPFYNDWQYETVSQLVYDIMLRNSIPYSQVVAHGSLQGNRIDPEEFDWTRLEDRLYELDDCVSQYTYQYIM
jgi:N-acetyl-anhydromuramyl-L-alanine amidase AmpD